MNIFFLSSDPVEAAMMMCDKHLNKMALESMQMLATGARLNGATDDDLFNAGVVTKAGTPWRSTHQHHPSTRWVAASQGNARWLAIHAEALCIEHHYRFGTMPSTLQAVAAFRDSGILAVFPDAPRTAPPQAMPDDLRGDDTVEAYRRFYHTKTFAVWAKKRPAPTWWRGVSA